MGTFCVVWVKGFCCVQKMNRFARYQKTANVTVSIIIFLVFRASTCIVKLLRSLAQSMAGEMHCKVSNDMSV